MAAPRVYGAKVGYKAYDCFGTYTSPTPCPPQNTTVGNIPGTGGAGVQNAPVTNKNNAGTAFGGYRTAFEQRQYVKNGYPSIAPFTGSNATGTATYIPYIAAAALAAGGGFAGHHFGKGKMLWTVIGALAGGAAGYFIGTKI